MNIGRARFLVFAVAGCARSTSTVGASAASGRGAVVAQRDSVADHRAILAALLPSIEGALRWQGDEPRHLIFMDSAMAAVAAPWIAARGFVLSVPPAVIVCPGQRSPGLRGYVVRTEILSLTDTSAAASYSVGCETDRSLVNQPQRYGTGCTREFYRGDGRWVMLPVARCWIS